VTHLSAILAALVPLFGLILLGAMLARAGFPGEDFWPGLERFIYFVLFPALLIEGLATAQLDPGASPRSWQPSWPRLSSAALWCSC